MAAAAAAPSVTTMMAVSGVGGGSSGGARPAGRPAEAGSRPPRNVPEQMSVWTRSPETRAKTVYCLPTKNSKPQLASDRSVETQNVRVATPLYTASTAKRMLIGSALEITKPVMGGSTTVTVPRNTTSARAPCCAAVCCTQEQASTREPRPSESAPATTANVSKRTTLVTIAPGTIGNVRKKNRDRAEWERTTYADATKRIPERAKFETTYGAPLPPLFDGDAADPGLPGEPPYVRGIQPTMYRGRLWTMRQYAGFGTAEESNARSRYLPEHGQTGLSVAFDLPTQMGSDAAHPRVAGEVGKVGVSISSLEDFARLFEGIPLGEVTTSMTINATATILLAMYVAVGKRQGVSAERIGGTTKNDILKEYIARGTYIFPPRPSMRLATDLIAYSADQLPRWNPISISGYHIREAGADAVQELAFTFANAIAYVRAALDAGLAVDRFATQLSFFFAANSTLLEEVAKFRAARRIWYRVMTERFAADDPDSSVLRFHTQTMGSTLTAQQPRNNIVRTAIEALAAVPGGTQSLDTHAHDEALGLPTEEAARIALRTQQIIAYESNVVAAADPLGGSYAVEHMTLDIERRVWEILAKIDEMGGALVAIERGYPQREIEESAYRYQREIESGDRAVVGVNAFRGDDAIAPPILKLDERVAERQRSRLRALRARRDVERAATARADLIDAARGSDNLSARILACVQAHATLV